jgi:hypothetical protein
MRGKKEKSELVTGIDGNSYFLKRSIPKCIIVPGNLTTKALEDLKKSWEKAYSGLNYGQSPVVEFFKKNPVRKPYFRMIRPCRELDQR